MHERFADWLEAELGERIVEQQEIVGYHLERAHDLLAELGPADARQATLARACCRRTCVAAGRRAFDRGDMPAAVEPARARGHRSCRRTTRRGSTLDRRRASLLASGLAGPGTPLLDEAVATANGRGDRRPRGPSPPRPSRSAVRSMTDAGGARSSSGSPETLLEVAGAAGDDLGVGWAWHVLGGRAWQRCRPTEAGAGMAAGGRSFPASRRRADGGRVFRLVLGVPLLGPMPCDRGAGGAPRVLRKRSVARSRPRRDRRTRSRGAAAMQGDVDEARRTCGDVR